MLFRHVNPSLLPDPPEGESRLLVDHAGNLTLVNQDRVAQTLDIGAVQALVSEYGIVRSTDHSADISNARGLLFPMNEGAGSSLSDSLACAAPISISGTLTNAWTKAGWFTHDTGGNTIAIKNNVYVDSLLRPEVEGSIIVGGDYLADAGYPSADEYMISLFNPDAATGGIRLGISSTGRLSLNYRGPSTLEVEAIGISAIGYNVRHSFLIEMRIRPASLECHLSLYLDGYQRGANVMAMSAPFTTSSVGGAVFTGYGNSAPNRLGMHSTVNTVHSRNYFIFRTSGADRNIAGRLAAEMYDNAALPSWLRRI